MNSCFYFKLGKKKKFGNLGWEIVITERLSFLNHLRILFFLGGGGGGGGGGGEKKKKKPKQLK